MASRKARPSRARSTSEQAQTGAGAGTAGAGSGAEYMSSGAEVTSDIGQAEAYVLNMKRLVEGALDHDSQLRTYAAALAGRATRNAEDHDEQVRNITVQALQNAVQLAQRVSQNAVDHDRQLQSAQVSERERTVRHSDLAIDRQWNVDEISHALLRSSVFQDAIGAAVATGVAKALAEEG